MDEKEGGGGRGKGRGKLRKEEGTQMLREQPSDSRGDVLQEMELKISI